MVEEVKVEVGVVVEVKIGGVGGGWCEVWWGGGGGSGVYSREQWR